MFDREDARLLLRLVILTLGLFWLAGALGFGVRLFWAATGF